MKLRDQLVRDQKLRWIDIGCGGNFEDGFDYLDIFAEDIVEPHLRLRYHRVDILNSDSAAFSELGVYDLVRLQHTLEHFSLEEARQVLINCAALLERGGVLLITVPDLRVHIEKYLSDGYKDWEGFKDWALKRIPEDAPASFFFSIFTHSMPYESHRWCYDAPGLEFLLQKATQYEVIRELKFTDPEASQPFTHNRPEEDLCFVAKRIG